MQAGREGAGGLRSLTYTLVDRLFVILGWAFWLRCRFEDPGVIKAATAGGGDMVSAALHRDYVTVRSCRWFKKAQ